MKKIESKIIGYEVGKKEDASEAPSPVVAPEPVETVPLVAAKRPSDLEGDTYKISPGAPYPGHAVYITINNIIGSDGELHPFEIFINSKDMQSFEWIVALTRIISFIFRLGLGNSENTLMANELKSVFNPGGGFYPGKGSPLPMGAPISMVASIGFVLDRHFEKIGAANIGLMDGFGVNSIDPSLIVEEVDEFDIEADPSEPHKSVGAAAVKSLTPMTQCPNPDCGLLTYSKQGGCGTCLSCSFSDCG